MGAGKTPLHPHDASLAQCRRDERGCKTRKGLDQGQGDIGAGKTSVVGGTRKVRCEGRGESQC